LKVIERGDEALLITQEAQPMNPRNFVGREANKPCLDLVKESSISYDGSGDFLGDLEYRILAHFVEPGPFVDFLASMARSVGADARRVHDSLKKLLKRGFVERVGRGWYKITEVGKLALLKLPVRNLSKLSRRSRRSSVGGASEGKADSTRASEGKAYGTRAWPLGEGAGASGVAGARAVNAVSAASTVNLVSVVSAEAGAGLELEVAGAAELVGAVKAAGAELGATEVVGAVRAGQFLGDLEHEVLAHLAELELDADSLTSIARSIGADVRRVHDSLKKLVKRGFVEKVKRGWYRMTEAGKRALIELPVRRLSKLSKPSRQLRSEGPDGREAERRASSNDPPGLAGAEGFSSQNLSSRFGEPLFGGLFLDNLRCWSSGRYRQLPRDRVLDLADLVLASNKVSYFEVGYWVRNIFLDGFVAVYTNPEDGLSARVEWRPPKNYVKRNGVVSTLRFSKQELIKAFKALAIVLKEVLTLKELSKLFSWLSSLWRPSSWSWGWSAGPPP